MIRFLTMLVAPHSSPVSIVDDSLGDTFKQSYARSFDVCELVYSSSGRQWIDDIVPSSNSKQRRLVWRWLQHVESVPDIVMGMCYIRQKKILIINLSSIFDHEWRDLQGEPC